VREIRILFSLQRVWCNFFSHDRILLIYFFISSTLLVLIGIVFLEEKIYFSIFVQHFLGAFKTSIEKPIFFFFTFHLTHSWVAITIFHNVLSIFLQIFYAYMRAWLDIYPDFVISKRSTMQAISYKVPWKISRIDANKYL
jgi:hypothetical protein